MITLKLCPCETWPTYSLHYGWGQAIQETIIEVFEELDPLNHPSGTLEVRYYPKNPITFDSKNTQYRIIGLHTKPNYYSQLVYQLAHELGHYIAGHNLIANTWFEEALCELSGLYFLRKASQRWAKLEHLPHLRDFAPNHADYANDILGGVPKLTRSEIPSWYAIHCDELSTNNVQRELNREAAVFLLPYFESNVGIWNILARIPQHPCSDFSEMLRQWEENCKTQNSDMHIRYFRDCFGA